MEQKLLVLTKVLDQLKFRYNFFKFNIISLINLGMDSSWKHDRADKNEN